MCSSQKYSRWTAALLANVEFRIIASDSVEVHFYEFLDQFPWFLRNFLEILPIFGHISRNITKHENVL